MEEKLKELITNQIENTIQEGLQISDLEVLSKLVDIQKDLSNIEYWKKKEETMMRYRYGNDEGNYGEGNYGRRGVPGTGRRRYRGGRGSGHYRGEEIMDEMMYHYGNYSESGQYGAEGESMEALSNLMESAYEYFKELKENANSQDEVKMMEYYFKKMGQM